MFCYHDFTITIASFKIVSEEAILIVKEVNLIFCMVIGSSFEYFTSLLVANETHPGQTWFSQVASEKQCFVTKNLLYLMMLVSK